MVVIKVIDHFKPSTIERLGGIKEIENITNAIPEHAFNPLIVAAHLAGNGNSWCCIGCGSCCIKKYSPLIFLTYKDIQQIAEHFSISITETKKRYVRKQKDNKGIWCYYLRYRTQDTDPCIFNTGDGCRIYKDRPLVCRIFPLKREEAQITIHEHEWCIYYQKAREITEYLEVLNIAILTDHEEVWQSITDKMVKWFGDPEDYKGMTQKEMVIKMALAIRISGVTLEDLYELAKELS